MLFTGAALGGAIMAAIKLSESLAVVKDSAIKDRRNDDEPLSIDTYKAFGQILPKSGHPEETWGVNITPQTLGKIKKDYASYNERNTDILSSEHFNNRVERYQQMKGPSDEVKWPTLVMGSNWYTEAVAGRGKPYTRVKLQDAR
jgi:hypothetical protein